jgi:hypothetical protein
VPPAPEREPADAPVGSGRSGPLEALLKRARPEQPSIHERLVRQVQELTDLHVEILSSMHGAISEMQRALSNVPRLSATEITLSVGPFTSVDAVRAFERELERLPAVREVTLRGYEGEDRAVLDVQLSERTT